MENAWNKWKNMMESIMYKCKIIDPILGEHV